MRSVAPIAPTSSAPADRGFDLKPGMTADLGVTLWGDLGLGWFGRLSSALARRGISIQSAQAVRRPDDTWRGSLELMTCEATVDPETLDFLALAEEDGSRIDESAPVIERFRIERTETGAISLRLFGSDQIGLLSGLLERMEFLGLFPERLRVMTNGEFVDDTIWLRGVAGHAPGTGAEQALIDMLSRLRGDATRGMG